ncbi:MAG: 30S ribosomal protein S9 [Desulfobacterales bacterium]|nr:30S ribosomal protein S9 [Desulfobacterales bacterium]
MPDVVFATGRRKTSVARVRIRPGTGRILVNGREMREFFPALQYQEKVLSPLKTAGAEQRYDVMATIHGGGLTGQAGALCLGIARGLKRFEPGCDPALRDRGLLTRDSRMKERKKYGLHGARRGVQFSKR